MEALRFLRGLSEPLCSPLLRLCRTLALVSVELFWGSQRGFKDLWSGALSLHVTSWLLDCGTGYKDQSELGSAEPRWRPEQREGQALIPPLLLLSCFPSVLLQTWLLLIILVLGSWMHSAREAQTITASWKIQGVVWCGAVTPEFCTRDSRLGQSPCPKTGHQFGFSFWGCEWSFLHEEIVVERTHNRREVTADRPAGGWQCWR